MDSAGRRRLRQVPRVHAAWRVGVGTFLRASIALVCASARPASRRSF